MNLANATRLAIALVAAVGGIAAIAAWREARAAQRMFRTLAAHQLKTPLSAVLSSLYTVYDHSDHLTAARLHELLETAISEAHELDRLLSSFLTLSVESGSTGRLRTFRRPLHVLKRESSG
jgi:signal transduction histidine kinase